MTEATSIAFTTFVLSYVLVMAYIANLMLQKISVPFKNVMYLHEKKRMWLNQQWKVGLS